MFISASAKHVSLYGCMVVLDRMQINVVARIPFRVPLMVLVGALLGLWGSVLEGVVSA